VYRPFAEVLVAASPVPMAGRLVLDAGSGTGAVAQAAAMSGAHVVAAERDLTMLNHQRRQPWPRVAADVLNLPFKDDAFDAALAGFLINHMDPKLALAELARVVGSDGVVLASTWAADGPDPVKVAIDTVMAHWGWTAPLWYRRTKEEVLPITGSPGRLTEVAEQVGLVGVRASIRRVDLALPDPAAAVAYRMALPHTAAWVATLDHATRQEVTGQAVAAVAAHVVGWRPAVIVLAGRRRGPDRSGPVPEQARR
jgi:SAM-dependent methyltransferase